MGTAGSSVPPRLPAQTRRPEAGPWVWALAAAGVLGALVLWRFEPAGQFFFPRCWLYEHTGLQCPGCGGTRALHALLHGEVRTALKLNPLAVAGVGIVAWLGLRWAVGLWTGSPWRNPFASARVLAVLAGLAAGFGVVRNLPW